MNDAEYIAAIAEFYKDGPGLEFRAHYERLMHISAAIAAAPAQAQEDAVATPAQPLHVAATSCPHEIDKDKIVLHFDSKQPGKNALAQLAARLQAAQAQLEAVGADPDDEAVPANAAGSYTQRVIEALYENGDPVSVDAAEELQRLAAQLEAAGGVQRIAGPDTTPVAQAMDAARAFWQQHTQADALSMTMKELHVDVERVIRAARGAAPSNGALAAPAQPLAHVSQETFNDDGTSDSVIPALPIGMALYAAPVRTVWVNLYGRQLESVCHPTEEDADKHASPNRIGGKAYPLEIEE